MTLMPPRRKPRWVTIKVVQERFGIGRSTVYEYTDPDSANYIPEFPKSWTSSPLVSRALSPVLGLHQPASSRVRLLSMIHRE